MQGEELREFKVRLQEHSILLRELHQLLLCKVFRQRLGLRREELWKQGKTRLPMQTVRWKAKKIWGRSTRSDGDLRLCHSPQGAFWGNECPARHRCQVKVPSRSVALKAWKRTWHPEFHRFSRSCRQLQDNSQISKSSEREAGARREIRCCTRQFNYWSYQLVHFTTNFRTWPQIQNGQHWRHEFVSLNRWWTFRTNRKSKQNRCRRSLYATGQQTQRVDEWEPQSSRNLPTLVWLPTQGVPRTRASWRQREAS